ncbi:MAG TPA: AMP-binding protein [Gemmatimonadales bacterium]|nr:AMP-binding protein [Gemmatimonadales bacterium]
MTANVAQLLWDSATARPTRPAVIEGGGGGGGATISYSELRDRASQVAAGLTAAGLQDHDRVGIFLDGGADAVAAFFGVVAAGGIAVVINESLRPRQVEHTLEASGATMLITSEELLARQPRSLDTQSRILHARDLTTKETVAPRPKVGLDPAQIVYTSGSTGLPKGVTVTHANLLVAAETVIGYLGITANDRIASILPFSFVYGMSQVLCAVGSGATLVIERSPLASQLVADLRARDVTVLAAVPPLWQQLLNVAAFRDELVPSLRVVTNAGGHLPVPVVRALRRAQPHARLFLMYGLTEVLRSTFLPPEEVDRRPDSMGRAIPGAEVLVLRDDLTPCEPGEVGELVHRGSTVTLGYWNDPEETARVFRPHPLRPAGAPDAERVVFSGDLVRRDAEGWLYFVGRSQRMIKTLGYRVSPDEIATVLYASGEVAECIITSEPDEARGERIVAHVVLSGSGSSIERLRRYAGVELPRHMQPARFDIRESLPRLPSGKHDVAALRGEQKQSAWT